MFTFKQKLVLSMMAVVSGITLALLLIAERKLQSAHEARFQMEFNSEFSLFAARQQAEIGALKSALAELSTGVRFIAALIEWKRHPEPDTAQLVYDVIYSVLETPGGAGIRQVPVLGAYDATGRRILLSTQGADTNAVAVRLAAIEPALPKLDGPELIYLNLPDDQGDLRLHQVLLSRCYDDEEDEVLGTVLLGTLLEPGPIQTNSIFGLWVEDRLHVEGAPDELHSAIREALRQEKPGKVRVLGKDYAFFARRINKDSPFSPAYHVSLQPLEPLQAEKRDLRNKIAFAGALALLAALGISLVLAGGLTAPIEKLVEGTHQIESGNFEVNLPVRTRDEIGQLTQSFNEMAAGLLLREKYRSVLDMVSDKQIAEDLIHGQIELGGEEREVSVLFCDIRGFTALTERMEPKEVIEMLNQHFTPLTRIVHEHHGAVDKFVGDLIMAIFGAPKSFGNDIDNAARCALRMIEERTALNQTGKYKISIGIGVASGKVVAGRMGSKDRLNYTVLGPRVNLASRLCSQAGRMEVVVDDLTWLAVQDRARGTPTPELRLKGFAEPVRAYKLESISTENESQTNIPVAV